MRSWLAPGRFWRDIADARGRARFGRCFYEPVRRASSEATRRETGAERGPRTPQGVSEKRETRSTAPESWRENAHWEPLVELREGGAGLIRKLVGDELLMARPRP